MATVTNLPQTWWLKTLSIVFSDSSEIEVQQQYHWVKTKVSLPRH